MPAISVTAPAKVILFGEHTVVYGHPAIAVPIHELVARVTIIPQPTRSGPPEIEAPQIDLRTSLDRLPPEHPIVRAFQLVAEALGLDHWPALHLHLTSSIPVASGMGSSAATAVALVRALSAFMGRPLSDAEVCELAYRLEQRHHGTPSGIDNTVITFDRPIFFVRYQPVEFLTFAAPLHLLIADTGVKSLTREAVAGVRQRWEKDPILYEARFKAIGELTRRAKEALIRGKIEEVGTLMTENHRLLVEIGVSSPELDRLVKAAVSAGALGAKLSGGGQGGIMIALAQPHTAHLVEQALYQAGAVNVFSTVIPAPTSHKAISP
ncbi:mevalonate kinase [uncultured Thermanaerothrix sp.]|uniref:mevalonate kinase n=1 Tax=uncultured Thermanaerothrix sp. TaxID=1195149 RepID=UPI0026087F1A|nr:mevalonate kinase [uncultured Thermanaerothrix sp.]